MKILAATITLALAFVSLCVDASAQKRTVPKTKPRPEVEKKPSQAQYTTQPFDPSVTSLRANFLGHNVEKIYKRLEQSKEASVKGEFETTEQFRQRISAEASKPLIGALNRQSILAFVGNEIRLESKYNADQQVMSVKATLESIIIGINDRDDTRMSLLWNVLNQKSKFYTGSNALGAKVTVERIFSHRYQIAFTNSEKFPIVKATLPDKVFFADIEMDVQKAMKAKGNLRLLVVCRLAEPSSIIGLAISKPTFSDPREIIVKHYSLNTELLEFWIFDASTGEVYLKQKPL